MRPRPWTFALPVLWIVGVLVPTEAMAAATGAGGLPPEEPSNGLVYDGLRPARAGGPCDAGHAGHFEIRSPVGGLLGCTHGPDPAPSGTDLSSPSSMDLAGRLSGESARTETVPCIGDGISGFRVQAIYAYPGDMASRSGSVAPLIRGWAATNVDDVFNTSAAKTGGSRRVRFVTDATCQLDVAEVALPVSGDDNFSETITQLRSRGFTRSDRKYLVWMDTPPGRSSVYCGIGQLYFDESDSVGNYNNGSPAVQGMVSRIDAGCWGSGGTPVEAHELMHNLGGVQPNAPHSTSHFPSPAGGHCTDDHDVMCYDDDGAGLASTTVVCGAAVAERRFDCGDDDYFSTDPAVGSYLDTHWNTADSRFLLSDTLASPSNDAFADATELLGETASVGSTIGASKEPGEPAHAGQPGGSSVWYRWEAPVGGWVTARTVGSSFDTLLGVYTGDAIGTLAPVAANDDSGPDVLASEVSFQATAGATYRIAVDGYGGDAGAVVLEVMPSLTEPGATDDGLVLTASRKLVSLGARVRLKITEPNCHPGDRVDVRAGNRTWSRVVGGECSTTFRVQVRRRTTFRAFAFNQSGDLLAGSKPVTVRVRRG